jgi:hypothetical protein
VQGRPVFDWTGRLVGVLTTRSVEGTAAPVILPSAEVEELVKQALATSGGKEAHGEP